MKKIFTNRSKQPKGWLFINPRHDGVALACVSFDNIIEAVDFLPCDDVKLQAKLLKDRIATNNWMGFKCVCILQSSEYRLWFLDAPNVPEAELKSASYWLIKDLIKYDISEAAIDVFPVPVRQGQAGKVYVVSMQQSKLQQRADDLHAAGVDLQQIGIAELALARVLSLIPEASQDVAVMYMDKYSVHILVCRSGMVRIIRDVSSSLDINKTTDFSAAILEVQRSLDFYQSHLGGLMPTKLYLTPRVAGLHNFQDALLAGLNLKIDILNIHLIMPDLPAISDDKLMHCLLVLGAAKQHQTQAKSKGN